MQFQKKQKNVLKNVNKTCKHEAMQKSQSKGWPKSLKINKMLSLNVCLQF